jgi:hypothetical protein
LNLKPGTLNRSQPPCTTPNPKPQTRNAPETFPTKMFLHLEHPRRDGVPSSEEKK